MFAKKRLCGMLVGSIILSIRNNCTGYNLMMEKARKLTNIKCQIVFAMESTAHYWLALYTRLKKDGYTVVVINLAEW